MIKDQSIFLKSHLEKVLNKSFHPTKEFNKEYYDKIPHVFYKYRECNENNFDALENEYLWLVTADEFEKDLFDSTIYYDLEKQRYGIQKLMKQRLPEAILVAIKRELGKKGIKVNFTKEDMETIMDNKEKLIHENGQPKINNIKSHLLVRGMKPNQINNFVNKLKEYTSKEFLEISAEKILSRLNKLNEITKRSHFVSCLTLKKDNDVMWDNYAANKSGFCIAYDISKLEEIGLDKYQFLYELHPMIYKKRNQFDISSLFDLAIGKYMKEKNIPFENDIEIEMHMQIHTKKPEYDFESEWRLIVAKKQIKDQKHKFPFASAIYSGYKISENDFLRLQDIAHRMRIRFYKQVLNRTKSDFKYERIF